MLNVAEIYIYIYKCMLNILLFITLLTMDQLDKFDKFTK